MSNFEGMYCVYFKKLERSDSILRHSKFDILRFCGSPFNFVKFHTRFHVRKEGLKVQGSPLRVDVIKGLTVENFQPLSPEPMVPDTWNLQLNEVGISQQLQNQQNDDCDDGKI